MQALQCLAATAAIALSLTPVMACDDFDEEMALAAAGRSVRVVQAVSPRPAPGRQTGTAAEPLPSAVASVQMPELPTAPAHPAAVERP
jgi:hypothetical protein